MDRPAPPPGVKFVLAFAGWASLAFVPAWLAAGTWQRMLLPVAAALVTPRGTELEALDVQLFYPVDVAVFVALCLASSWAGGRRRWRALGIGVPVLVVGEVLALALAIASILRAAPAGGEAQGGAMRLADALLRIGGLGLAALTWFVLLGRSARGGRA